ncbi:MAG TPA: site-specific integrase [Burkholderiaceae bacterium]|jgi:integrase
MKRSPNKKDRKIERNIEARTDGYSFRVRMKVGDTYINETFFSIDEARAYRDLLRAGKSTDRTQEMVLRAKIDKKKEANLTVSSLLERYRKEVTIHKKGCREETYTIGKLQRFKSFSNLPIFLVDGDAIEKLKRELSKSLSDTTVRKYLMLISHLFKTAVTKRWCRDLQNPIKTIELPRPARMRSRRIELDEHEYLVAELRNARNPLILPVFEFLIETACRRGEVLRLRVKDIDLSAKTAALYDTKNGEDRVIGLSSRAIAILEPLIKAAVDNKDVQIGKATLRKVFPLKPEMIRCAFEEAKKRALKAYREHCLQNGCVPRDGFLVDLRLHDSRREATSRYFEKGLDIMEVSSMTGHKTLSMLRGYTNLRARDLARKLG